MHQGGAEHGAEGHAVVHQAPGGAGGKGQQRTDQAWQNGPAGAGALAGQGRAEGEGAIVEAEAATELGQQAEHQGHSQGSGQEVVPQQALQPRGEGQQQPQEEHPQQGCHHGEQQGPGQQDQGWRALQHGLHPCRHPQIAGHQGAHPCQQQGGQHQRKAPLGAQLLQGIGHPEQGRAEGRRQPRARPHRRCQG